MIEAAEQLINAHFSSRVARYGPSDARGVWNSWDSQQSRFEILAGAFDLNDKTVLDVGCGLGDFAGFLRECGVTPSSYLGVDISQEMIVAAQANYPDERFEVRDLAERPFEPESFDYVFESGIFNILVPEWEAITFGTIRAMFSACREGVALNFLSKLSGNNNPAARYSLPSEIVRFVETELSPKFTLRHDYRTNDFSVFVYK